MKYFSRLGFFFLLSLFVPESVSQSQDWLYLSAPAKILYGIASWYSESDPSINRHTANGEIFEDSGSTCASWDYPFNTLLKVTNLETRKSTLCRVNDRGPAKRLNRVIDLTQASFAEIANLNQGLIEVSVVPDRQGLRNDERFKRNSR
ncbi:MAG: septal ring lytic transglycosylase RlpA family protein [Candidatus Omnitrophica bacterium]|nr:septal ring lytic transglycosylase RlpA family protein [Candidatus Omnitrophota bacterium]